MAKPVNPDMKQVALEVLGKCFDMATRNLFIDDLIEEWAAPEYATMSPDEARAYQDDVCNFIEAILEGEITMRKPGR